SIAPLGGDVAVAFDEDEARLLRGLLNEMKDLLEHEAVVQDDVIDRLFPAAYAEPEDAESFRELVGDELKTGKQGAILSVLSVLGEDGAVGVTVPRSEIDGWLTALTDVRLALGTRFDVTEEKMGTELEPDDPEAGAMAVLHWLGWMQEMFIRAISEEKDDG
ncbi:MAG: hypothetical protein QOG04_1772, partial [Actinomycetota bacterium]|nr:hypothetical protein [Actinomycetota bacterium]